MTTDPRRVQEVFLAAVELDDLRERGELVARECAGNDSLQARVEALLRAHDRSSRHPVQTPVVVRDACYRRGAVIGGRYKLLEEVGEGGMGTVWAAEQLEPLRRRVAVKLVKPGMDTRQVLARFDAERQALALMDHPHIAKVFDGGRTDDGRPYFVMEFVQGCPITEYCDRARLSVEERLKLFMQVCQAVQHAHQKGIVHRDLKPSNILVGTCDDQAVPRVIDFGLAKALSQPLTENTLHTVQGLMIGTPMYMSPEQAEFNNQDIDTRSDIYSLGALLYELLTGTTPLSRRTFKNTALHEIVRLIKEEEPSTPSTKISSSEDLPNVAAQRSTEPAQLKRRIRGDLDWIVMKSLDKDRTRRYETAIGLARDVERFLLNEPVEARPQSVSYRFGKLLLKHRGAALVSAAIVLLLLAAIVGTGTGMFQARHSASRLKKTVDELQSLTESLEQKQAENEELLISSLVGEANARTQSGRTGQRFGAIAAIRQAADIRVTPELRYAAAMAVVLPDVEIVDELDGFPAGSAMIAADRQFEKFSRMADDGRIDIFRRTEGREVHIADLPAQGKPPYYGALVLSHDGRYLAVPHSYAHSMTSGGLAVWDLAGPQGSQAVAIEPGQVHMGAIAFHASGTRMAVGHPDASVSLFELPSGKRTRQFKLPRAPTDISFSPEGDRLAVAAGLNVHVLDWQGDLPPIVLEHKGEVQLVENVAWHPDGERIVTGCFDYHLHWWDVTSASEILPAWNYGDRGIDMAFNDTGDLLATTSWSTRTILWDVASGRQVVNSIKNLGLQFSAGGNLLGVGRSGKELRIARVAAGREMRILSLPAEAKGDGIWRSVVSSDSRLAMTFSRSGLGVWDLETGERLALAPMPHEDSVLPVAYGPDGSWLTAGSSGLWRWPVSISSEDPRTLVIGKPDIPVPGLQPIYTNHAATTPDGRLLVALTGRRTLTVYDRDGEERTIDLGQQSDAGFCAVSPDGRWIATCSHSQRSKALQLWDAATGEPVRKLDTTAQGNCQFSPDSKWLTTSHGDTCDLWEVGTWKYVRLLGKQGPAIFSPDSRLIARGDPDQGIGITETATGREIARVAAPGIEGLQAETFTPDGRKLIARGDNRLFVFDLALIRHELAALNLDWDWPPFPSPPPRTPRTFSRAAIVGQPLANDETP